MKPSWKKYLLYASLILVVGGLIFFLVETVRAKNTGFETKTLWDWMELLIIPLFLAGGAFFLNRSEKEIERKATEDRAKLEREIAIDRQQEAALQAYLDRMAELLLKEKLRTTDNEEVREVARIRTLTVLRGLDAKRKGLVIKFLREASLISLNNCIVDMSGADLSFADLKDAHLSSILLIGVNLSNANLHGADLRKVDLSFSELQNAKLDLANLSYANLRKADLSRAGLGGVNFENADLFGADLSGTYFRFVKLSGANLDYTDLSGAEAHDGELEKAKSLSRVIMPDGRTTL